MIDAGLESDTISCARKQQLYSVSVIKVSKDRSIIITLYLECMGTLVSSCLKVGEADFTQRACVV